MVLAVLADLGGRRTSGSRRLIRVDRDSIDPVLRRMEVATRVPDGTAEADVRLQCMEDFHPDALVQLVPGLAALLAGEAPAPAAAPPASAPAPVVPDGASLLDAMLDAPSSEAPARSAIADLARRVARPWTIAGASRRSAEAQRRLTDGLRAVLHAPAFQALESTWRGLDALVQDAATGDDLAIVVLDAARDDAPVRLAEELVTPGAPRPTCVLAAYSFGPSGRDLESLERFGAVALAAGVPLFADASPAVLGLDDARELDDPIVRQRIGLGTGPDAWRAFRRLPAATNVTLCLPRVLLRAPYGASSASPTAAGLDEGLTGRDHARFLWGSAALAYGRVLARAFAAEGWDADLARHATLDGLPVHVWREGGEECVLPCAEVVMSDATAARVAEQGLLVVSSVRGTDRVEFRSP
jgi:type VI secretion system protein ImpC